MKVMSETTEFYNLKKVLKLKPYPGEHFKFISTQQYVSLKTQQCIEEKGLQGGNFPIIKKIMHLILEKFGKH